MENVELTSEERKILERRGFCVKQVLSLYDYFTTLFSHISFYILSILFLISLFTAIYTWAEWWLDIKIPIFFDLVAFNIFYYLLFGWILGLWIYITYKYSIFKYGMVRFDGSIIINKSIYNNIGDIPLWMLLNSKEINSIGGAFLRSIRTPIFFWYRRWELGMTVIGICIWIALICVSLLILLFNILAFLIGISLVYILTHTIILNYFLSIWLKIQKLTPKIEKQSKKIQSEFQSDMDFGALSNGFDELSSTFSKIVSLILKLEKVEKRANKWNLFDSAKYINSLRSDIVEPLKSLKGFLEIQKSKLLSSQAELTQVQIDGSESTGNVELQSKRSESLIIELTGNIEKLNEMIGKMG